MDLAELIFPPIICRVCEIICGFPCPAQEFAVFSAARETGEFAVLSREEMAQIKAEIKRLEKARDECTDTGTRERIEAWIEEQKKALATGAKPG